MEGKQRALAWIYVCLGDWLGVYVCVCVCVFVLAYVFCVLALLKMKTLDLFVQDI